MPRQRTRPPVLSTIAFDDDVEVELDTNIQGLRDFLPHTDAASQGHIRAFIALAERLRVDAEKSPVVELEGQPYGLVPFRPPEVLKWLAGIADLDVRVVGLLLAVYSAAKFKNALLRGAKPATRWHATLERYLSQYRSTLSPTVRRANARYIMTREINKTKVRELSEHNIQARINEPLCCRPMQLQEMLWRLVFSPHWEDVFIALALATGRRLECIYSTLEIESITSPLEGDAHGDRYWARLSGLVKKRGAALPLDVPLLLPTELVRSRLHAMRGALGDRSINAAGIAVRGRLAHLMGPHRRIKLHALRAVYVHLAHAVCYRIKNKNATLSIRPLLGHSSNSSLASYATVTLIPDPGGGAVRVYGFQDEASEAAWIGRVFMHSNSDMAADFQRCWSRCEGDAPIIVSTRALPSPSPPPPPDPAPRADDGQRTAAKRRRVAGTSRK